MSRPLLRKYINAAALATSLVLSGCRPETPTSRISGFCLNPDVLPDGLKQVCARAFPNGVRQPYIEGEPMSNPLSEIELLRITSSVFRLDFEGVPGCTATAVTVEGLKTQSPYQYFITAGHCISLEEMTSRMSLINPVTGQMFHIKPESYEVVKFGDSGDPPDVALLRIPNLGIPALNLTPIETTYMPDTAYLFGYSLVFQAFQKDGYLPRDIATLRGIQLGTPTWERHQIQFPSKGGNEVGSGDSGAPLYLPDTGSVGGVLSGCNAFSAHYQPISPDLYGKIAEMMSQ